MFFFLGGVWCLLYRSQTADFFVDIHKGTAQLLIFAELGDFVFRFPHGDGSRQCFTDGSCPGPCRSDASWTVTRVVWLGAMTRRFATATTIPVTDPGRRSRSRVIWDTSAERCCSRSTNDGGIWLSFSLYVLFTFRNQPQKRISLNLHFMSHTHLI